MIDRLAMPTHWEYVLAAYGIWGAVFAIYGVWLVRRWRAVRRQWEALQGQGGSETGGRV